MTKKIRQRFKNFPKVSSLLSGRANIVRIYVLNHNSILPCSHGNCRRSWLTRGYYFLDFPLGRSMAMKMNELIQQICYIGVIKTDRQDLCPQGAFWYFRLLSVWLELVFTLRTQCFLGWSHRVFAPIKWNIGTLVTSAKLTLTGASIYNILTGVIIFLAGIFLSEKIISLSPIPSFPRL